LADTTTENFKIDDLYPVKADKTIFDNVVWDEKKKDIIKTLVESHQELAAYHDDLMSGKGIEVL